MSEGYQAGGAEHQPHHHNHHQLVVGGTGGGGSQLLPFYFHVPQHSRREKLRYPPCTDVNDSGDPSQPAPQPSYNTHAYAVPPAPGGPPLFIAGSGVPPPPLLPPPPPPPPYLVDDHNTNPSYSTAADVAAPSTTTPAQFAADIHNQFHQYPYYPFFPHQPVSLSLSSSYSSAFHNPAIASAPAPLASRCPPSAASPPPQPFTGYAAVLKGSRFLRPAQLMLQEICDVGALGRAVALQSCSDSGAGGLGEPEPLSPGAAVDVGPSDGGVDGHIGGGERRRIKTRLVSMLDEVCRRYRQYYHQILAVVSSFEAVAGLGNAAPYTSLALNSMTKHFRYLRNAISDQLRFTEKAFGKESCKGDFAGFGSASGGGGGGIFFHGPAPHSSANIGQPSVWRPQRGLPERAVAVLKAWLFEHFLHPYPTDTDKHMLAKQTGLTRNQVSNWFINARVRLWKPLVEEIHSLEMRQSQKGSKPDNNSPAGNDPQHQHQPGHVVAATSTTDQSSADHPSSNNRTNDNKGSTTTTHGKSQDPPPPPKRFRNEEPVPLAEIANNQQHPIDEPIQYSFGEFSGHHHHHQHLGATTAAAIPCTSNGGVSLTLGLHQNDGMCQMPEPLPYNVARRFGLEEGSGGGGYGLGGGGGGGAFEVQDHRHHRHFGKGIDGHLLRDFVG